jgi:predicted phosphodiesterase
MAKILILGDVHGKWADLNSVMKNVDFNLNIKYNFVIQVGDFGFFPSIFANLDTFNSKLIKNQSTIGCTYEYSALKFHKKVLVCDGNHDSGEFIKKSNHQEWKDKYNIHYQPRGSWIDIDRYKIGFLGGGLHADRKQEGSIDKETTNYILNKQVKKAIEEWNSVGGMDTIITHSCPSGLGIGMEGHPALYMSVQRYIVEDGYGEVNHLDCGDAPLTMLYNGLIKKPSMWYYGHFHRVANKKIGDIEFICVGSTDSSDHKKYVNPFILDTKTNSYEFHNKKAMNFDGEHSTWVL